MNKTHYEGPVAKLLKLREREHRGDWRIYAKMGLRAEHVSELIRMMTDPKLNNARSGSPEGLAPIHAWRALGELKAEAAIGPLIGMLHYIDEHHDDCVAEEIPWVLGMIGPAAIFPLRQYLLDPVPGPWAKHAAASALKRIAQEHPETRDECVAVLTQQLERYEGNDPIANSGLVSALLDLRAVEAAPAMERAYAANKVPLEACGDWEQAQIELGLLKERRTPARNWVLDSMNLSPEARETIENLSKLLRRK